MSGLEPNDAWNLFINRVREASKRDDGTDGLTKEEASSLWDELLGEGGLFASCFLAGFAVGQASRTPRPYTAKMLECAKRWRQHLKLTDDYEKLLDGFINEVESK